MVKIWNRETILEERAKNNFSLPLNVYRGSKQQNLGMGTPDKLIDEAVVKMAKNWEGSEGYLKLKKELNEFIDKAKNIAQPPTQAEQEEFFGKVTLDITKRVAMMPDFTTLIATEIYREDFPENPGLHWFLDFIGEFTEISLTGEAVPLIQQATGKTTSVAMHAWGIGFQQSLKNVIYNTFYDIAKVNMAVSKAYTDRRNSETIGRIVSTTYTAGMKQAADTTSGATPDVLMYKTLDAAEDKLRTLKDFTTDEEINVSSISLLVNSHDRKRIMRVIDGQLNAFGKTPAMNLEALNIDNIIEYDKGMTHGKSYGKDKISFPGVEKGKAYMFVPRDYFWVLVKRRLTQETSPGRALTLTLDENSWYYIQTVFDEIFFGSSKAGTTLADGYGAIIEITLP